MARFIKFSQVIAETLEAKKILQTHARPGYVFRFDEATGGLADRVFHTQPTLAGDQVRLSFGGCAVALELRRDGRSDENLTIKQMPQANHEMLAALDALGRGDFALMLAQRNIPRDGFADMDEIEFAHHRASPGTWAMAVYEVQRTLEKVGY